MQPWYWTGIAINLCQILGLHRNLDSVKNTSSIDIRQQCLWRRLWWTSFFRERWLALTLGRPLRINLDDCDVADPTPDDMFIDIADVDESMASAFLPDDMALLAGYWVQIIELSKLLGTVLTVNYQRRRPKPTLTQIEGLERELLHFRLPDLQNPDFSRLAFYFSYHLHLHFQLGLSDSVCSFSHLRYFIERSS